MWFRSLFVFLLWCFMVTGVAQEKPLSPLSKISLLTVGTADELSSKFGHTALRIQDSANGLDIVFGYGGFDFQDPLFYYKFTTGKLDYSMTGHRFRNFLHSYKQENRWVYEQDLSLSQKQKDQLFAFLKNNYREENRYYKYDFLFDNCATKIPEVFQEIYGSSLDFSFEHLEGEKTFRQLIHEYLVTNSWSALGIDLALGSVIDRKASSSEYQFLPLYVREQFKNVQLNGKPLISKERQLLDVQPIEEKNYFLLSPLPWLLVFLILVVFVTYRDYQRKKRARWFDFSLFLINGIAGLLIAFLWFATDHSSTKMNFNILWALVSNLVIAFFLLKRQVPLWLEKYLYLLLVGIGITGILWIFKIQVFSPFIIFILLALGIRYLFLVRWIGTSKSIPSKKIN